MTGEMHYPGRRQAPPGFFRTVLIAVCFVALGACISPEADSPIEVSRVDMGDRPILIQGVSVFDTESLQIVSRQDVLVKGGLIVAAGPGGGTPVPTDAFVISGEGATLILCWHCER